MPAAPNSDFFGGDYLGYDPYHQATSDMLGRFKQIDDLVRGGQGAQSGASGNAMGYPGGFGQVTRGTPSTPATYSGGFGGGAMGGAMGLPMNPALSFAANMAQRRGTSLYGAPAMHGNLETGDPPTAPPGGPSYGGGAGGGGTVTPVPGGGDNTPNPTPGNCSGSPPSTPCANGWICTRGYWYCQNAPGGGANTPGGSDNSFPFDPNTGWLPPDLGVLRNWLGPRMMDAFANNPSQAYPGQLGVDTSFLQQPWNMAAGQAGAVGGIMDPGYQAMQGILGYNNQVDPGWLRQFALGAQGAGNMAASAMPWLQGGANAAMGLANGGGFSDLSAGINAIQANAMNQLDLQNAQQREQFGKMGLGAGSDLAEAQARGSSTGLAQMASQQQQYLTQARLAEQQNQLGAIGALGQLGGQAGNLAGAVTGANVGAGGLENDVQNLLLNNINTLGNLRIGAANTMGNYAGIYGNSLDQSIKNMMGLGQMQIGAQQWNQGQQYNDWLRQQGPSPWQNAVMGYATGFPPQPYPQQMQQGPSTGAMIGSSLMGMIPYLAMMSDRNVKEDVRPLRRNIMDRLRKLPISTWKYKGDSVRHLGPMAQDFQRAFGVGDGTHIHLVDAIGVALQSLKEIGNTTRRLEARLAY